jgi:DnaJ-class molecular chaperone
MNEQKLFSVDVERGMKNGDTIKFEKMGEQVPDMIQGDVVFTI